MSIFRKLFGGSRPENPRPQPVSGEAKEIQKEVEVSGEIMQDNFNPEHEAGPRVFSFEQYKFGKKLESDGGPIIGGSEHRCTGKSENLVKGTFIHPDKLFSYKFSDLNSYPWKDEGGEIIKKLIERDGKQYVVVARRMLRSEAGEEKSGRLYTEMHQIVIPAEEWSVAAIPQLTKMLEAKGVTELNPSMPSLEMNTNILDQPFQEGWPDDYTKEIIASLVTGKPLAMQDWKVTQEEFLNKLFSGLICLPEHVARQISFGTGLSDSKEGSVRIAHTKVAKYKTRKIGGNWKGLTTEDEDFGKKYMDALIKVMEGSKTPREVMKSVTDLPQEIVDEVKKRFFKN